MNNNPKKSERGLCVLFAFFLGLVPLWSQNSAVDQSRSTRTFEQGDSKLVVYSDVPGATASPFYTIRVRSAATRGEWQPVFAHLTQSLYSQAKIPHPKMLDYSMENYQKPLKDWSHTYGNIEMEGAVEVEIAKTNGGMISKAATHPAIRAGAATVNEGKAYFNLEKPAPITIDIDGQMDDKNTGMGYEGPPIHAVSLFANPIFEKPVIGAPGVVTVEPGSKPPTDPSTYSTLYFSPGVHDLGRDIKVYENKKYYIPGDAIVYGTFNNLDISQKGNVKIYGVGTISGDRLTHPAYDPEGVKLNAAQLDKPKLYAPWKPISLRGDENVVIEGVCIANPAYHSIALLRAKKSGEVVPKKETFARWVKVISWRANGDGIGSADLVEDCFFRCADDCSYIKGDRRRCVFWKDVNAAVFHMANIPSYPIVIEDCDVIYLRSSNKGGGVFNQRGEGLSGVQNVNVLIRNIRVEDRFPTSAVFSMYSMPDAYKKKSESGSSYSGIVFENISAVAESCQGIKNKLSGSKEAPWNGGITFKNVVIAGKKITNLKDFETNSDVSNIKFEE